MDEANRTNEWLQDGCTSAPPAHIGTYGRSHCRIWLGEECVVFGVYVLNGCA